MQTTAAAAAVAAATEAAEQGRRTTGLPEPTSRGARDLNPEFSLGQSLESSKQHLVLKTRNLFRVPFIERYRTYVGYEQLADKECLRAYEEATAIKNAVLAAAKALRAVRKSELDVSSRNPSPSNAHMNDRLQVPPERSESCSKQGPLEGGPEGEAKQSSETPQPPPLSPRPPQQKLQTASESKE